MWSPPIIRPLLGTGGRGRSDWLSLVLVAGLTGALSAAVVAARNLGLSQVNRLVEPSSDGELARLRSHLELARAREAMARDAERHRVARELHDTVLPTLFGIAAASDSVKTLAAEEPSRARAVADYVAQLARTAQEEMRALILELRLKTLELEGLGAALESLARAAKARHALEVELRLEAEPDVPVEVKQALFRIAQEALHNTGRHARAARARVILDWDGEEVTLEVADDGVGFDPAAEVPGHLGQRTMRERAELEGGSLEVVSAPGRGTRIVARIPADAAPPG